MKVSIITATYNSAHGIEACLESILCQDHENIECIIVDGQSKDQTLEIVSEKQKKHSFIKVVSEADKGIYDALNKGIALASGDIIGFVHSDDLLASSTVISEIVKKISYETLDGVYGNLQYVNKEDTTKVVRFWKSRDFNPLLLHKGWMPPHTTLFLKKEVYDKHGDFNLKYKIAADYDFMLRVLKDYSLNYGYLPCVITKMRVGGISNRGIKNIILKSKEDYSVLSSNKIGGLMTLIKKNTSKISQFIFR
jgi:glycosyltransferase involved in cell wall biosynthesis